MRKEAKEFRLKKAHNGFDHKSHSMKLSYLPLPDKLDEKKEHFIKQNVNSQIFGHFDNGNTYFDMHRFLNDCANGDVNLPAPFIEMINNDINKISKQFTEELQKGQLDHHFCSNRSKKPQKIKQSYLQTNGASNYKNNSYCIENNNEIEMQSSKLEEVKQTLVDTNSTKKQKLK